MCVSFSLHKFFLQCLFLNSVCLSRPPFLATAYGASAGWASSISI